MRLAAINDVGELVNLHHQTFKGVFLEKLGDEFLRYSYSCLITRAVSFVYIEDNKIVGFIAGTIDETKLFTLMEKLSLAYLVLKSFFFSRINSIEMADFLRYFFWAKTIDIKAQLLLFMVEKNHRYKGIGSKLLKKLEDYFREVGVNSFKVFADDKISQGIGFYLKRHFIILDKIKQRDFNIFCLWSVKEGWL